MSNIDLVFTGVDFVSLPSTMTDPAITELSESESASFLDERGLGGSRTVFRVESGSSKGFVAAASMRREENYLALFETNLEHFADIPMAGMLLEKQVLLALSPFKLQLEPSITSPNGRLHRLDALVEVDGERIGVEVKWVAQDISLGSLRNRVMELVGQVDPWLDHVSALLFVVGDADEAVVQEAQRHLASALPSVPTMLISFSPRRGSASLPRAVETLVARAKSQRQRNT